MLRRRRQRVGPSGRQRASSLGVGLLSGGYGRAELQAAGAYRVYADPEDMLDHLEEVGVRPAHSLRKPVVLQLSVGRVCPLTDRRQTESTWGLKFSEGISVVDNGKLAHNPCPYGKEVNARLAGRGHVTKVTVDPLGLGTGRRPGIGIGEFSLVLPPRRRARWSVGDNAVHLY